MITCLGWGVENCNEAAGERGVVAVLLASYVLIGKIIIWGHLVTKIHKLGYIKKK